MDSLQVGRFKVSDKNKLLLREIMKQIEKLKVGDKLYGFCYPMIGSIVVQEECVEELGENIDYIETDDGFYSSEDFGKTLFMTKEEAKVRATEMERIWLEEIEV